MPRNTKMGKRMLKGNVIMRKVGVMMGRVRR
jgi:hypothetical protein